MTRKRVEGVPSYRHSAAGVVGLGWWDDRFATYDNNYYGEKEYDMGGGEEWRGRMMYLPTKAVLII